MALLLQYAKVEWVCRNLAAALVPKRAPPSEDGDKPRVGSRDEDARVELACARVRAARDLFRRRVNGDFALGLGATCR
jgi:hypothetical protein